MIPCIPPSDGTFSAALVLKWSACYPANYDAVYYDPWLAAARAGDSEALERITEWKNVSASGHPMKLSAKKRVSLDRLRAGLPNYLVSGGRDQLQSDFERRAPVYSIFWCHVLYGSPIFDVYTHVAFAYFSKGVRLSKRSARIFAPGHWNLYASYEQWFGQALRSVQSTSPSIDSRMLDRALFKWGEYYS